MLNAISQQSFEFDRFWWNLAWRCTLGLPMWWATKNLKTWKSKMADGGHLDNRKIAISPKTFWPTLTKFCMMTHISPSELQELKFLKIQDGGWPPVWKKFNVIPPQPFDQFWRNLAWRYILGLAMWWTTNNLKNWKFKMADSGILKNCDISKTVWPILTKCCMMTHISPPELTSCSKHQIFKNPRWRTAAILKIVKCDIWATVWPILVKFGMAMPIRPSYLMVNQKFKKNENPRRRMAAILKIEMIKFSTVLYNSHFNRMCNQVFENLKIRQPS